MPGLPRSHRSAARGRTVAAACAAAALILAAAPARAQDTRPGQETRPDEFVYRIPAEGIPLEQLVRDAEAVTGRTFIFSDKSPLRGKTIRLLGEARVPKRDAYSLFQALFVTQGYALKPLGEAANRIMVVEAIETAVDLKQRATFVLAHELDQYRNEVGTVVMTFFQLKYVKIQNVRAALAQLLTSKAVEVTLDVESANALLVIGFAPTVYALKQIIAAMDVPQPEHEVEFALITLTNAVAEELEPILLDLIASNAQPPGRRTPQGTPRDDKPPARLIADPRLNALAAYAVASDMAEIRQLVAALDAEAGVPSHDLRIYRLKHTNAEDVADVLSDTIGVRTSGGSRNRPQPAAAPPGSSAPRETGGASGRAAASGRTGGGGTGYFDDVHIVAEPHNNALIIRASATRYAQIAPIIAALDQQRPQVLIRGVVAELTMSQLKSVGAEIAALDGGSGRWHPGALTGFGLSTLTITSAPNTTGTGAGSGTGTGGGTGSPSVSNPGDPNLVRIPFFPGNSPGNTGGVFGFFSESLNVPLLISLLQNGRRGNLVSTPLVLANDNTKSMIETSRQVATQTFQTGQTGDTSSFGGYQEAKISLTVSPHISNDDYVRLDAELLVEAFLPATDSRPGIPPDKTSRTLVGSVTLRNGDTALVGGLILDQDLQGQDGIPVLADAELLGPLFRRRSTNCERTAIYFFLMPTIISTFATLDHVSYEKKLEVQKLQGPVRLIDPNFRPILLDHPWIAIEGIEASGNLDVPRYCAIVPLKECGPAARSPGWGGEGR
jgi:general secretion pathway protein D